MSTFDSKFRILKGDSYRIISYLKVTYILKSGYEFATFHGSDHNENAALFLAALKRKLELESVEQGEAKGGG